MNGYFRTICGAVSLIGFMLLLGTVGAMDFNEIPLWQAVIQAIVGMVMFAGGAKMGGLMR